MLQTHRKINNCNNMPKKTTAEWKDNGLMRHYKRGTEDMDSRRTRKNGWNEVIDQFMGKIPKDWPFAARVTEPLIRTTILEKNGRLLNAKLRGRLAPREGGDTVGARVNNAVLDYQWDKADNGGSMLEKIAMTDMLTRLFGAIFVLTYWDTEKECNEYKIIDPRDMLIDPSATHIKNARWIQIREWTTKAKLKEMGYEVSKLEKDDSRDTVYDSAVKDNRGLDFRSEGEIELVTEWTKKKKVVFLPKHGKTLETKKNWRKRIPVAQLRYYPLPDDIYGDSECESVISLARAINWFLSGFVEATNIDMAAPVIIPETGVQMDTIEYTPRAIWIANDPNRIRQITTSNGAIQAFSTVYPMLKAAFGTAMGSQSLGISHIKGGKLGDKTATEVDYNSQQQTSRDQYNQLYLGEFLKDVMMMWLQNNQKFMFDDPRMHNKIIRILGRDEIKALQQVGLDDMIVPEEVNTALREAALSGQYSDAELRTAQEKAKVPKHGIVTNPEVEPENYIVDTKLKISDTGDEAKLYVEPSDMEGEYDYIPDVKSMSSGAIMDKQKAQREAFQAVTSPEMLALAEKQGYQPKFVELVAPVLESSGYGDAENLFEQISSPSQGINPAGAVGGLPEVPPAMAGPAGAPPGAEPQGMPLPG